jgi:tripartite motif-containing protein 33
VSSDAPSISQNSNTSVSHTVSSSMPKTPSPAPHEKTDETQKSLDKFCQKSLNDLMLTIAKLDSNGIMVIPETQKNQLDSAQVDSSTDEGVHAMTNNSAGKDQLALTLIVKGFFTLLRAHPLLFPIP